MKYHGMINALSTVLRISDYGNLDSSPQAGDINYCITTLLTKAGKPNGYEQYSALVGILETVKMELYRRMVAPYEDKKCKENGDVF